MKKLLFSVIVGVAIIVTAELAAFLFFSIRHDQFTFYDPADWLITDEKAKKLAPFFHPTLGWKKIHHNTPFGERPRQTDYGVPRLSVFGDSFTYCEEVEDHETWEERISQLARADIYNFGSGGYGVDQAFLRFREDFSKVKTRFVALGLITENLNRAVNVYRKFYYPKTKLSMTKPRFVMEDGKLKLLPNPIKTADDLIKLKDPEFVESIGKNDYWRNFGDYPVRSFPYLAIFLNKVFRYELMFGRNVRPVDDNNPRPWRDLWTVKKNVDLIYAIFDKFVEEAANQGAIPMIVLLPQWSDAKTYFESGKLSTGAQAIDAYGKSRNIPVFNGVTALVAEAKDWEELKSFYVGHISPKGNRVIGEKLHRFLKELGVFSFHGDGSDQRSKQTGSMEKI